MATLENIKEGDTVYRKAYVSSWYYPEKSFYIPIAVIKTTKTQLTVKGGKKYNKSTGKEVGGRTKVLADAPDETSAYLAYKNHLNRLIKLKDKLDNLELNIDIPDVLLTELETILDKL